MNLSIIIPVYNAEKYIENCLNSIKNNLQDDTEVIIIDDGSTDNSFQLCSKFLDSRIKIYKNKNNGVSYSRNYGIEKASGKWILFVDADDLLEENWYAIIKKYFDTNYNFIMFSKNKIGNQQYSNKETIAYITNYYKNQMFLAGPWSKLYSRNFLIENSIKFDEKLINGEDMIFNIKNVCLTNNYVVKKQHFYKLRINTNSSTHQFKQEYIDSDRYFHRLLDKTLNNNLELDKEYTNEVENYLKQNAIIGIAYRLSLSGSYKIFKKNKDALTEYNNIKLYKRKTSFKIRTILILIKLKFYLIVFFLFNIKRSKKNKEYFIDI